MTQTAKLVDKKKQLSTNYADYAKRITWNNNSFNPRN